MNRHAEWLSLIEISGPFLAVPVLHDVFPQGFEELDGHKRKHLRQAYDEWREAWDLDDPQFAKLHRAWIEEVLARGLELNEDSAGDVLKSCGALPESVHAELPEYGIKIFPDFAVVDEQQDNKPLLLVKAYDAETDLEAVLKEAGWASSPAERMVHLCRATDCRLGLVTNGERWMLIDAPVGAVTTFASWYARIWTQEPITLQAFVSLLGVRRFFLDETEQLPALLDRSLKYQDEVTDALGEQVRRAVEVLIQSLDRADVDRNRELLVDVTSAELYEAGLTVMMRLVFLLCAEERGLLLMGEERYEANYAISTLRMHLRSESEEILERRMDAWSRLLATFRAVYGGIDHENLFMPALGGSLFDPNRFPFLEGRSKRTDWKIDEAKPLPIDNRTVLLLLDAIQSFEGRTLSYRALDVEQIGYVYEGLLERTVKSISEVTLELDATKSSQKPWVTLDELDAANARGEADLVRLLRDRSGSSESRIRNDLAKETDDFKSDHLLTACHGDRNLRDRVKRFFHLLRTDPWGYPLVYPQNAFIVTAGADRRETGTHYTPKSLTENIVRTTLEPVVYVGPAEGKSREEWILKSSREILDLKVCDPAMGSGAFLVQVCRYLGDKLVEAWLHEEATGKTITVNGKALDQIGVEEPLPSHLEERLTIARRLVAERCLYGVDLNPLAVELAKLSIWLVTLAKGRPFGFLDHNLRCGDSLLGIHRLDQLTQLSMTPSGQDQLRLFGQNIERAMREAIELRLKLREIPIRDIKDVEAVAHLDGDARRRIEVPESIADAFIGEVLRLGGNFTSLENTLVSLYVQAGQAIDGDRDVLASMRRRSVVALSIDLPADKQTRRTFHWPLEFPEVFAVKHGGFSAIVGNPPFLGGKRITGVAGKAYRDWLIAHLANGRRGSADLVAYFFLRAWSVLRDGGGFGLLAVNTIAEGDTRQVGLEALAREGAMIYAAYHNEPWPGKASVVTSRVHVHKGPWKGAKLLNGREVEFISAYLSEQEEWSPARLKANERIAFQGSVVVGMGFVLTHGESKEMLESDPENIDVVFPYLSGDDINSQTGQRPTRSIICFWDWSEDRAKKYEKPWRWIEKHVKPERQRRDDKGQYALRKPLPERWWQYGDKRPGLYHRIGWGERFEKHPKDWMPLKPFKKLFACSLHSKHLGIAVLPSNWVYAHGCAVFASESMAVFALLSSSINEAWTRKNSSSLGATLRYVITDAFETLPFCRFRANCLDDIGGRYERHRTRVGEQYGIGLTEIYNRLHDPENQEAEFNLLRELHCEMDREVAAAYHWDDLELDHGFYEVPYLPENDRVRFTISEAARIEVLRRLAELNQQRYKEEVSRGLHAQATNFPSSRVSRAGRSKSSSQDQPSLDFGTVITVTANNGTTAKAILGFLSANAGWHGKADILAATSISDGQWNAAITDLIAVGEVERQGKRRGARYRVVK